MRSECTPELARTPPRPPGRRSRQTWKTTPTTSSTLPWGLVFQNVPCLRLGSWQLLKYLVLSLITRACAERPSSPMQVSAEPRWEHTAHASQPLVLHTGPGEPLAPPNPDPCCYSQHVQRAGNDTSALKDFPAQETHLRPKDVILSLTSRARGGR